VSAIWNRLRYSNFKMTSDKLSIDSFMNSGQSRSASDGTFIYVHIGAFGLFKVGSGLNGSEAGKVYAHNSSYRVHENIRLNVVHGVLYVHAEQLLWPTLEILDCESLQVTGLCKLGVDPECGVPSRPSCPAVILSDQRYLYLIFSEHHPVSPRTETSPRSPDPDGKAEEKPKGSPTLKKKSSKSKRHTELKRESSSGKSSKSIISDGKGTKKGARPASTQEQLVVAVYDPTL